MFVDVRITRAAVYFSGSSKPIAAAAEAGGAGAIALGRQMTAMPEQYQRRVIVSCHQTADIQVGLLNVTGERTGQDQFCTNSNHSRTPVLQSCR